MLRDVARSSVCAGLLGAFSAAADWLWANHLTDGAVLPAVVHGAVLFLLMALALAWAQGSQKAARRLAPTLPAVGFAIAAAFYPVASVLGYLPALLFSWVVMWLAVAFLLRWAAGREESALQTLLRGGVAALASGLAFWSISGIWTTAPTEPPNYLLRFLLWSYAFLPGFLALLVGARTRAVDPPAR